MQTQNPIHSPLYAAGWGILAMMFAPLALGLVFLTDKWASEGNPWGAVWVVCAVATALVAGTAMRELSARVSSLGR